MLKAELNRVNDESKIIGNFARVKFLLNFKHQILAEISSGVMLFLRCKPHNHYPQKSQILTLPCVSFTLRSMEHVHGLPSHFTMKILRSTKIYDWI